MSFFLHLPVTAWPRNLVPGNLYFLNILNPDLYRRYIHVNHKCRLEVLLSFHPLLPPNCNILVKGDRCSQKRTFGVWLQLT